MTTIIDETKNQDVNKDVHRSKLTLSIGKSFSSNVAKKLEAIKLENQRKQQVTEGRVAKAKGNNEKTNKETKENLAQVTKKGSILTATADESLVEPVVKLTKEQHSEKLKDASKTTKDLKNADDEKKDNQSNIIEVATVKENDKTAARKLLMSRTAYDTMLTMFRIKFPKCFTAFRKPLALNIRRDLIKIKAEKGISYSNVQITKFFKIYCGKKVYKDCLILGASRINLDGELSSLVTAEQLAINRIQPKDKILD